MNNDTSLEKLLNRETLSKLSELLATSSEKQADSGSIADNTDRFQRKMDMISAIMPYLDESGQILAKKLISILTIAKALKSIMETF